MNFSQNVPDVKSNKAQSADNTRDIPLIEYLSVIIRGRRIILFTTAIVTFLTALYTFSREPVYEASSLVLINVQTKSGALPIFDQSGTVIDNKISNELEILKSQSTAQDVAGMLRTIKYLDDEKKIIIPLLTIEDNEDQKDTLAPVTEIRDRILNITDFTPLRETDIIKITTRSRNPKEAALVANIYTEVYTNRNLNASRLHTKAVREFLQTQLQSRKNVLDTTERELQNYMRSSGVVSLDGEGSKVVEQLSQLEAQRDGIEVDISSRQKTLLSYKEEIARLEPGSAKAMGETTDNYIRLLQDQIAKLEVQRDIVVAKNPELVGSEIYSDKLQEIDQQIALLKKNLQARTQQFLGTMMPGGRGQIGGTATLLSEIKQKIIEQQIELQGLEARKVALDGVIRDYERKFNQLPKKSMELAKLQRSRLSNEKLYLLVEEKFNETAIKEKSQFGYVEVVDQAVEPTEPLSSHNFRNVLFGFIGGAVLGICIAFVWTFVDTRIQTPEDLKRHGFVTLTSICQMEDEIEKVKQDIKSQKIPSPYDYHLITYYRPMAPIAESYRHLRTNIQHLQSGSQLKCFVVTSANPEEGKTTTVSNLAVSLAQAEKKVLLVNADLRRSMVQRLFGLKNDKGLTDFLNGSAGLADVLYRQVMPNLDIINAGSIPHNPSEILGSKKMKEFLRLMKEKYDVILFDTPPLLAVTDASALALEADGVIIVVSANITKAQAVKSISEYLASLGIKVLGAVLNNYNANDPYSRYSSGYSYGYYGYGSEKYYTNIKNPKK